MVIERSRPFIRTAPARAAIIKAAIIVSVIERAMVAAQPYCSEDPIEEKRDIEQLIRQVAKSHESNPVLAVRSAISGPAG